jgi:uncharacterized protein YbjT (DUF2867 family)
MQSSVLLVGATGLVGLEICRQLRHKNQSVKAMIRTKTDPGKIAQLKDLGVETVVGDLKDKTTFPNALAGVTTVIDTVSAMPFSYIPGENDIKHVDEEGAINLINAGKAAGAKHFIYVSVPVYPGLDFPLSIAKRRVEQHLIKSGLLYTILRPNAFMEVWLSPAVGFDALNGKVNICGSGGNPLGYISLKDVAKFAVESITNPAAKNAILELGGPENLSQLDAVKIFEEGTKKKIEKQHVPVEALRQQMSSGTDPMGVSFAAIMIAVANGGPNEMSDLCKTYSVKLTSVEQFVHSIA